MSIGQLLEISRRSLQAHKAAINATGQNISNAETDGYKRRRVSLEPTSTPNNGLAGQNQTGSNGTGVQVKNIERIQDRLLERSFLQTSTGTATAEENARLLGSVEAVLSDSGSSSLNNQLSAFWNSWEELGNSPTSRSARQNVRSRAQSLVSTLHRLDSGVEKLKAETEEDLTNTVSIINDSLGTLADLNEQIATGEASGSPNLSAEDRRDQLVAELAEKIPVTVQDGANEFTVQTNGVTLVQGTTNAQLKVNDLAASPTVEFVDSGITYSPTEDNGGKLGAQLEFLYTTVGSVRSDLDALASELVDHVNNGPTGPQEGHTDGMLPDGTAAGEFFDSGFTTAGSIRLHQDIQDDVDNIAAASNGTAPGDNTVALNIASVREEDLLNGDQETPAEFVAHLISDIGSQVREAKQKSQAESTARDHVAALRDGVSGVSMNEEMTNLIKFQQAFGASARVVSTARELSDTLLSVY
jgi:flagellar hook-associated protein 1 FlgK